MIALGIDVECHGWTHINTAELSDKELEEHINSAKEWLENISNEISIKYYSTPFGSSMPNRTYYEKLNYLWFLLDSSKEYLFLREKYVPNQTICIFSDCGFSQKKGSIYLLSAIKELLDNQYTIKLILVGSTEISRHSSEEEISNWKDLCTNLETMYPQYIEFHDKITPEEVKYFLKTSDIYICPSLGEGCSNSVNKALLTGIPCIITDTGAAKEIAGNDKNVVFIEPGNKRCHHKYSRK